MFVLFAIYGMMYLLIPVALFLTIKRHQQTDLIWLGFLIIGIFTGLAPFVAAAYLAVSSKASYNKQLAASRTSTVKYNADGTYTVYAASETENAVSPTKVAFRIIGGIIGGIVICFGLFVVGIVLLFTLAPSVACGGSSKCY
jgi:vacuolar-type H+-ATPase subunit I/STV1